MKGVALGEKLVQGNDRRPTLQRCQPNSNHMDNIYSLHVDLDCRVSDIIYVKRF